MKRITLNESIGVVQQKRGGPITPCWESQFLLYQNSQVVKDYIAKDMDPREAVSQCHETHGECWFIQCPTISPPT